MLVNSVEACRHGRKVTIGILSDLCHFVLLLLPSPELEPFQFLQEVGLPSHVATFSKVLTYKPIARFRIYDYWVGLKNVVIVRLVTYLSPEID